METDEQPARKVALITGGSRGIGRAIAEKFASLGINLVINYASDRQAAEETLRSVSQLGVEALLVQANIANPAEVSTLFSRARAHFGTLDIVVANAGVELVDKLVLDTTEEDWNRVVDVNLKGTFFTLQEAARHVRDEGRIVVMSSTISLHHEAGQAVYAATKAGVKVLVEVLSQELGPRRITVNSIMPGVVAAAGVFTSVTDEDRQKFAAASPLGRMALPADVANVAAFLISGEASFVNGHHLAVNGGSSI